MPKGNLLQMYLPKGVMKAVNFCIKQIKCAEDKAMKAFKKRGKAHANRKLT